MSCAYSRLGDQFIVFVLPQLDDFLVLVEAVDDVASTGDEVLTDIVHLEGTEGEGVLLLDEKGVLIDHVVVNDVSLPVDQKGVLVPKTAMLIDSHELLYFFEVGLSLLVEGQLHDVGDQIIADIRVVNAVVRLSVEGKGHDV